MWLPGRDVRNFRLMDFCSSECTTQNKIYKLESILPKPYLMKLPFFAHVINSVWFQASMMLNKVLMVGNSGTTWKTKHPWIWKSFRDGAYTAGNFITSQKNEKISISVTVPSAVCFPLFYSKINCHASYAVWGYLIFKWLVLRTKEAFYIEDKVWALLHPKSSKIWRLYLFN